MTQTGLLQSCHKLCRKHLDMLRCVCDFRDLCPQLSREKVSVKVGVMELGLNEHKLG